MVRFKQRKEKLKKHIPFKLGLENAEKLINVNNVGRQSDVERVLIEHVPRRLFFFFQKKKK
jgi:hypothetical protein